MQRLHGEMREGLLARVAARLRPSASQLRVARGLAPYVWPSDRPDLQATVVVSLALMLVAKLVTVAMPFTFKWATDALVAAAGGAVVAAGGASEQATYDAGMAALRGASYDKAIVSFREVVTNYPNGDLASNAQFWIGESYYTKGDLENAVTAYRKVLTVWPDSRKAPDAMVKLGFSLSDLKRTSEARTTLEEVVRKYPGTNAAQLAADRLKRLGR